MRAMRSARRVSNMFLLKSSRRSLLTARKYLPRRPPYESDIAHPLETHQSPAPRRARQARPGSRRQKPHRPLRRHQPRPLHRRHRPPLRPPRQPPLAPKLGITNLVERATARADELTDDELRAGGRRLQAKVKRWRPTVVAFVGTGPYRIVSGIKAARVGLQGAPCGGSHAWVLPNPSGLNAHYLPAALARRFGDLRLWAIA